MINARHLPSLTALRAFEAAARHRSFTLASDELHVTQAAVSKQVRLLEADLGTALFVRRHRAVDLTPAGRELQLTLADAFGRIADTADKVAAGHGKPMLTLGCGPVIGSRWLRPRLARFRTSHREIEVNLETHSTMPRFDSNGVDVAILFGAGDWPGLHADLLFETVSWPVCSPELLRGRHALRKPGDLRHHTLLHDVPENGWEIWLKTFGVEGVDPNAGPRFRDMTLYVDAAADGEGVALGDALGCHSYLNEGRLVRPFDQGVILGGFYLVAPATALDRPKIAAFRDWVLAEAAAWRREHNLNSVAVT